MGRWLDSDLFREHESIKQMSNISGPYERYARHFVSCYLKIINYLAEMGTNVFLALKKSKCSTSDGTWAVGYISNRKNKFLS